MVTGSQLSTADPVADAMETLPLRDSYGGWRLSGVFVAFNRKVMLGSRASKVRTMSFDAFESINYPYIGEISSLGLHICRENLCGKKEGSSVLQTAYSDQGISAEVYRNRSSILDYLQEKRLPGRLYWKAFGLGRNAVSEK